MVFSFLTNLFKKGSEKRHRSSINEDNAKVKAAFERVKEDMERLKREADDVGVKLAGHNNLIKEHEKELKKQSEEVLQHSLKLSEHTDKIKSLEDLIKNREPMAERGIEATRRLNSPHAQLVASKFTNGQDVNEIIWDSFTPQEKRIIGVFMENKDMSLSYEDVGKVLNKAPSTIKNQMKNIELKGKFFDESRDNEQRKRFSMKPGLRINKSLE